MLLTHDRLWGHGRRKSQRARRRLQPERSAVNTPLKTTPHVVIDSSCAALGIRITNQR